MNLVEISEKIRDHLTKQKKRSRGPNGGCKYRAADGCMCAVGALISDDVYYADLEGQVAGDPSVLNAIEASGVTVNGEDRDAVITILRAWQSYHDHSYGNFMYGQWIRNSSDSQSPEAFHTHIIAKVTA